MVVTQAMENVPPLWVGAIKQMTSIPDFGSKLDETEPEVCTASLRIVDNLHFLLLRYALPAAMHRHVAQPNGCVQETTSAPDSAVRALIMWLTILSSLLKFSREY